MNEPLRNDHVLHVAAEMSPYASTGGLGEVVGSLPQALTALGWHSTVLLPRYGNLRGLPPGTRRVWSGAVRVERAYAVQVLEVEGVDAPRLWLLDCPELFGRDGVYGDAQGLFPDNEVRYAVLSKVAARLAAEHRPRFRVLHAHDWHAAPATVWVRSLRPDVATVLTIHNYAYRGEFSPQRLHELGLAGPDAPATSFLGCGIDAADAVTTVSGEYAREIAASDETFARREDPPRGIVNGLDPHEWDPSTDVRLASTFDADSLPQRAANKEALRAEVGLQGPARALAAFQGRFAYQKGLDILLDAAPRLLDRGVELILHGGGDHELERRAHELAAEHPQHVGARIGFDRDFSARLFAGIDFLIMPSRFEPCGLSQLQAMRYGAIPIAHATGGLKDTIHPLGERAHRASASNGFWMKTLTPRALSLAVGKALRYLDQPQAWHTLQRNAMTQDVSWTASAAQYAALYREVVEIASSRASELPTPPEPALDPAPAEGPPAEPAAGFALEGPPLAESYQQDMLHLAAQSPRMLYAYWEVPAAHSLRLSLHTGEERRELAVVPARGEAWIPVQPNCSYHVALEDEAATERLRSASVHAPVESLPPEQQEHVPGPPNDPPPLQPAPRFGVIGYPRRESDS